MKYLGILVSDMMLYVADLMEVGVKVEKRLPTWQGRLLSLGGKSILIESSLSAIPNYTLGVYLLPGPVHQKKWIQLGLDFIEMMGYRRNTIWLDGR
jgi:hypothetical protein